MATPGDPRAGLTLRHGAVGLVARLLFLVAAAPAVVRAALRVAVCYRRHTLEEAAARLRDVPPFRLPLARPLWLAGAVRLLAPPLPPWGIGPCLKRSLLLLDLWSRCGLEPSLHVGVERHGERGRGHAWVTAGELATSCHGFAEAFRF